MASAVDNSLGVGEPPLSLFAEPKYDKFDPQGEWLIFLVSQSYH